VTPEASSGPTSRGPRIEVTDELVAHIAQLARIALSPEGASEMKEHFEKVLGFIEELQQLDTSGVDPSLFSLEASNVFRDDEPGDSLPQGVVLALAPASQPPYFVVPRIVEGTVAADRPERDPAGESELG
jgi:aspartyl-tRNA(Asn)/glutamyl-tRNA(Gln) amidotransferase subunit C